MPCFLVLDRLVKKETVTGIIGNTQGVMSAISPPNNPNKNTDQPLDFLVSCVPPPQASVGTLVAAAGNKI